MKSQTDLIVVIVAVLCMLIGVGVAFGTKGEAVKPAPPEQVVTAPLQLPAGDVVMAASLPNAGSGPASSGPAGGGRGGPMMGGPGGPGGFGLSGAPTGPPPTASAGGGPASLGRPPGNKGAR